VRTWAAARAANAAQPADGVMVLYVLGTLCVVILVIVALAIRSRRAAHRVLRRCPICEQDAVQAAESRPIDVFQVLVRLQCGQCGIWRQLVTTNTDLRGFARRLEHDRRVISSCAVRLTREATRRDVHAFIRLLRQQISGPDDFLAATRASRRPPGLPENHPGGRS
jgi:hypothetical protein